MADAKKTKLEREYTIPLRKFFVRVPQYERTGRAIKAIKTFLAKHMKVEDRNVDLVKLDVYFNNEMWFRGRANPPAKVKVKAIKEGDIVRVEFVEVPEFVKFLKAKHAKIHTAATTTETKVTKTEAKAPVKADEKKSDAKKLDEKEKEASVAENKAKEIKADIKAEKHTTTVKDKTEINKNVLKQEHVSHHKAGQ